MSSIHEINTNEQISDSGCNCQTCDTKLIRFCPKCSQVKSVNDEWEIIKNEIQWLKKSVSFSLATHAILIAIIAILIPLPALSGVFFKDTCIISPKRCFATGKGVETAVAGERNSAVLHIVDSIGKACTVEEEKVRCEFVSVATAEKTKCFVKALEVGQYEIYYRAHSRGRHQVHIKVEGEHIKGSPFNVTVKLQLNHLGTPVRVIGGLNHPWGIGINQTGEIIVAEHVGYRISIFNQKGEKLRSFGSHGSGQGQLSNPMGVAVDDNGNILVADYSNSRLQKFTPLGDFVTMVNFNSPVGISIHPYNKRIVVANHNEKNVHILKLDLTLHTKFGEKGDYSGQFQGSPYDVAHDSQGNIYVVDRQCKNYCIKVFTAEGHVLRRFGSTGSSQGYLQSPYGIAIDSDDVVYVSEHGSHRVSIFKTDGTFITTFGTQGSGQGQLNHPYGIAVDKDGFVYVSDSVSSAGRIQIF